MKNRIRGIPLVLLLVAVLMAACGAIKNTTSEQTSLLQQSNSSAQLEAQAAAVHDTHRHVQEQTQTDSTMTRREYAEPVPEERTDMTIPTQNLLDLPDGAKYSAQNGRASIEAERQGDKIVVRGRCDSIARRCTYFENRVFRQRVLIDSLTVRLDEMQAYQARADSLLAAVSAAYHAAEYTKKPPSGWYWWLLVGFLAGGAASAWLTKTNPLKAIVKLIKNIVQYGR